MFWTPDIHQPPLLTEEGEKKVFKRIEHDGWITAASEGFDLIRLCHQPLGQYLNQLGRNMNELSSEGPWPSRALKTGACLTMLAYRETGYEEVVDEDALATGSLFAQLGGIPDTFTISASLDPVLMDFTRKVTRIDVLNDDGFSQVFGIGAGATRHYLQQAIAA